MGSVKRSYGRSPVDFTVARLDQRLSGLPRFRMCAIMFREYRNYALDAFVLLFEH